jgi:hypothetical protein
MENIGKMKIIFVVTETSIRDGNGKSFVQSLNNFVKMFEDIDILRNSLALLVNKSTRSLQAIRNCIQRIRQEI